MFDFAVSGPLAGMIASSLALIVGSQLTAAADPALFPSMPLEILRQSTLGGGIIEGILGNDILSIPDGARGTAAVNAMTVPLHPVALAGYFGLVVNALAVLPIGSKCRQFVVDDTWAVRVDDIFLYIICSLRLVCFAVNSYRRGESGAYVVRSPIRKSCR